MLSVYISSLNELGFLKVVAENSSAWYVYVSCAKNISKCFHRFTVI